jgi:MFS family permease
LLGFGLLNALLGPALPYLRSVEHIGYVVGALHQVAFAVGGGLAGLLAARMGGRGRAWVIRVGLPGAAAAALAIGYRDAPVVTVAAAFLVSLLGTSAMVRLWAALADAHRDHRTTALTEGEVAVSAGGIICPLLVGGLASTWLSWRFAFALGAVLVVVASGFVWMARVPPPARQRSEPEPAAPPSQGAHRPVATLVMVFSVVALEFSLSFWLASYLHDSVGVSQRLAVLMVAGLYAANLTGRVVASRLSRYFGTASLLAGSLTVVLAGTPILLAATGAAVAGAGLVVAGAGVGASFPLTSSLHVGSSSRGADSALGQVFSTAAVGQVLGPLAVGVIGAALGLRVGLLLLPALALLGLSALVRSWSARTEAA